MPKYSKGFTLIELMISITIIALLIVRAIPNFKHYNESQVLDNSAQNLASTLRTAQVNAQTGANCPSGKNSGSWTVTLSKDSYKLSCLNTDITATEETYQTTNYPTGVAMTQPSGSCTLIFSQNTLATTCQGTGSSATLSVITLTNQNISNNKTITIDKGGAIYTTNGSS